MPRVADYFSRSGATYGVNVSNDQDGGGEWARYLKDLTGRDGWSVARLAREAGLDRGTIFRWMRAEAGGDRVTVDSVCRIADAAGDERVVALRAAAGLPRHSGDEDDDLEITLILQSGDLSPRQKEEMIKFARQLQRHHRADLRAAIQAAMEIARGGTQAAT